jgi:excisionase family DNA binding protein
MSFIHSGYPPRPLDLNRVVPSFNAAARAQPRLEGLIQEILQLAYHLVNEDYSQPTVAVTQPSVAAEDGLLTVKQAASTLVASRQTIHNWVRKGYLKAYKIGGRTYFKKEELLGALQQKTRPDGLRKNARRSFAVPSGSLRKEVAYA